MLQITKNLQSALFVPVDYINDNAGNLSRGAMTWDTGDNVLITIVSGKNALGYNATTSDKGVKFVLNGDEGAGVYKVVLTLDRGARAFSCVVGFLVITDKVTTARDTFNGVYFYAQNSVLQFAQAYTDSDAPATTGELNALREQISRNGGGGGGADLSVKVTYAELKALRDGGQLVAGQSYRITDYTTLTAGSGSAAAGHDFDIIVSAIDAHTLNEDARAAHREGDEYFNGCNLAAWRLRYALDMDANRFDWVSLPASITAEFDGTMFTFYRAPQHDLVEEGAFAWVADDDPEPLYTMTLTPTQGEKMYDNTGEELPIIVNSYTPPQSLENGKGVVYYMEDEFGNIAPYDFKNIQFSRDAATLYTFSLETGGEVCDSSLNGVMCKGNVIKPCFNGNVRVLNDIVIHDIADEIPDDYGVINNTFGFGCQKITLGKNCKNNTFADNCNNIGIGETVISNVFGKGCHDIDVLTAFTFNNIGAGCKNLTIGYGASNNVIEQNCETISFGNTCTENVIGAACQEVEFYDGCAQNIIGAKNANIIFFPDCTAIYTGSQVSNLHVEGHTTKVEVKAGVSYVNLKSNGGATATTKLQNIIINSSVKGTRTSTKTVTISAGNPYTTTVGSTNDAKVNV